VNPAVAYYGLSSTSSTVRSGPSTVPVHMAIQS
jgi:hypothetical protein